MVKNLSPLPSPPSYSIDFTWNECFALTKLAQDAGTTTCDLIRGIVKMYLYKASGWGDPGLGPTKKRVGRRPALSKSELAQALELRDRGVPTRWIAQDLGKNENTMRRILGKYPRMSQRKEQV
jgi:hypothetical protein